MTPLERQFLEMLAKEKQGRCGFASMNYDKAMTAVDGLVSAGLITIRRYGYGSGFQITEAGRAYLGGEG